MARCLLTSVLSASPLAALLHAGEPIQFSGPKTKVELPSGREVSIPNTVSVDIAPFTPSPSQERGMLPTGPQMSLSDQLRLKQFIHEKQNWMFYDPHILSGRSLLDNRSGSTLGIFEDKPKSSGGNMEMLFGKPSDSRQPIIPLAQQGVDFGPRKNDAPDPFAWPNDRKNASAIPDFFSNRAHRDGSGPTPTRSANQPEASIFDILNPGVRNVTAHDQMVSRQKGFELLLNPPPPAPVSGGTFDPSSLAGDTTRQPFNTSAGFSHELPTASRLGSVLDPMQSFSAMSRGLRSPSFDDPNARYINAAPAPASASRQVESFKMLRSPVVSEFPRRNF